MLPFMAGEEAFKKGLSPLKGEFSRFLARSLSLSPVERTNAFTDETKMDEDCRASFRISDINCNPFATLVGHRMEPTTQGPKVYHTDHSTSS